MRLALKESHDGVIVPVWAQPKARHNGLIGEHAGRLKIAVTAAPAKGKANQAVRQGLADACGVKRSQVRLVSGRTAKKKTFLISGIGAEELRRRFEQRLG